MAYLHCHHCDYEQDDFWHEGYNPIRCLRDWEAALLSKNLDEPFTDDAGFIQLHGNLSRREVIARQLEKNAQRIRTMTYRTEEEMRTMNPERRCPKCNQQKLDID